MKKEVEWLLKEKYHGVPGPEFEKDVERLNRGEPLDYVIGFTEFLGCKIDLSKKPLIPRPETEYWVEKAIKEIKNRKSFGSAQDKINNRLFILDVFAGSGCVGVSIMRHINNAEVVFAEKDKNALEQIKINCKINNIDKEKYKIVKSDVFSGVKGKFDYIFANPPYVSNNQETRNKIQKSVLQYEPTNALFGGENGLFYIRKFLAKAPDFLYPKGRIYMEFDSIQKVQIEKLLKKYGYVAREFYKDQYGKWRWVVVDN